MKLEIELDEAADAAVAALMGTGQWGDTPAEVVERLLKQRIWQITGEIIATSEIGKIYGIRSGRFTNQVTQAR